MILIYIIYLLTFLVFPIIALNISRGVNIENYKALLILVFLFFVIHNIFFVFNYSIRGDYPDYIIFSIEYFFFSFLVSFLSKSKYIIAKVFQFIGAAVLIIGFLQGVIGIFLFIVISQDYESDKLYNFNSNNENYQTRRYSFGFATSIDTRYTFNTYKQYELVPFEKLINSTDFFDTKSELNFGDENFKVNITGEIKEQFIEFSSSNNKRYRIAIKYY